MTSDALVEAILGENPERCSQSTLQVVAFFPLVVKLEWLWKSTLFGKVITELLLLGGGSLIGVY